jgi:hypothetical protein
MQPTLIESPTIQLLIVILCMALVGTSLVSVLVTHGRRVFLWLTNWAWSVATWVFPAYDIPVPRWVLPPESFERMVVDGAREAHGVRVRTTIKAGEIVFHGIALKPENGNAKVVPFEPRRRA